MELLFPEAALRPRPRIAPAASQLLWAWPARGRGGIRRIARPTLPIPNEGGLDYDTNDGS